MQNKKLSIKYKKLYRAIAIFGFILILISCIHKIFITHLYGYTEVNQKKELISILVINSISEIAFLLIIIQPERLEFYSLISFIYMIYILISEPNNLIPVFMAVLCIATLNIRGFFYKRKNIKIALFIILYLLALVSEIRYGFNVFFISLLQNIAAFFILGLTVIIIQKQFSQINSNALRILDLTKYETLTEQDKIIIKLLKEGQKYEWIAGNLGIATSTLKKHTKSIFKILDVADLIDFHAQLGQLTFIYTKQELLEWKTKFLKSENIIVQETEQISLEDSNISE